jgi:hypothetical protein
MLRSSRTFVSIATVCLAALAATACSSNAQDNLPSDGTGGQGESGSGGQAGTGDAAGSGGGVQTQEQDIAQYETLTTQLEQKRTEFLGKQAMYPRAVKSKLFWYEFPGWAPVLHSYDRTTARKTQYTFSVGPDSDNANYSASESLVVTSVRNDDTVSYSAYAVGQPGQALGSVDIPAPKSEAKWWAYSVTGGDAYIVLSETGNNRLQKWTPGSGSPVDVLRLDDVIAPNTVGEFLDFAVDGNLMVFNEGGRLWLLDLTTKTAVSMQNTQEASTVFFDATQAAYSEATKGLWLFDEVSKTRRNLSDGIQKNAYQLNKTYSQIQYWTGGDWAKYKTKIVYISQGSCVFSYDYAKDVIKPILLEPRLDNGSLFYRYPQILDDGTLLVTGLQSDSGSVGADGPIYMVDKSALND